MLFLTTPAGFNETHIKQNLYTCLLQQSLKSTLNALFTVIWEGNLIFHFSLHINTIFLW